MARPKAKESKESTSSPRHMSLMQCAQLLDRDRNTIQKWIRQGCPVVQAADRGRGQSWVLDLAAVVRWREEQAASVAAAGVKIDPEGMSKEEADRRRAVALAYMAELELEEERRAVVRVDQVLDVVAAEYAAVRAALESVPAKLAGRLVGQQDPNAIRAEVEDSLRHALSSLKKDVTDAV
jgi:phage terminase Nu1 subunit (DNA packaging protein)